MSERDELAALRARHKELLKQVNGPWSRVVRRAVKEAQDVERRIREMEDRK